MGDWEELVDRQLADLALEPAERAEVIAELAAHLEEICQELRRQGMTEEEAVGGTLSQVEDWQALRRRLQSAKREENVMSNRVRQFWLPSLGTLVLSLGLLALLQIFGPNPWTVARKSRWSLIAPVAVVYLPWLLSSPVIGAMGAYLSIGAGGSRRAVFSSIVFPVLALPDLFPDWRSNGCNPRSPRCRQHHDFCLFRWSIRVGASPRSRSGNGWLASTTALSGLDSRRARSN